MLVLSSDEPLSLSDPEEPLLLPEEPRLVASDVLDSEAAVVPGSVVDPVPATVVDPVPSVVFVVLVPSGTETVPLPSLDEDAPVLPSAGASSEQATSNTHSTKPA